jgi:hypothetical protein
MDIHHVHVAIRLQVSKSNLSAADFGDKSSPCSVPSLLNTAIDHVRCPGDHLSLRVISPSDDPNGTAEDIDERIDIVGMKVANRDIRVVSHSGEHSVPALTVYPSSLLRSANVG